jgi:hypothetical protein
MLVSVGFRRLRCRQRAHLGEIHAEGLSRVIADGQQPIRRERWPLAALR